MKELKKFLFVCTIFYLSVFPAASVYAESCIQKSTSVTAVIFDVSDPLSEPASLAFDSFIARIVDEVEEGGRLDVYFIKDGASPTGNPSAYFCKPERPFAGGEILFKRKLQVQFVSPALAVLKKGKQTSASSKTSPIVESVFNVGLKSFSKITAHKEHWGKIVVISDLLQNSKLANFYSGIPSYEKFSKRREFIALSQPLEKVGLELVMLSSESHSSLQGRDLFSFWGGYGAEHFCAVKISPISRSMKGWKVDDCR